MQKKCEVGGQAVINGVMMKRGSKVATSVRKADGTIKTKTEKFKSLTKKPILGWPLIRGMIILIETISLGSRSLNYSAKESLEEDEEDESTFGAITTTITMILAIALAIGIFKFAPLWLTQLLNSQIQTFQNKYIYAITEGIIKLGMVVGYIYAISLIKDVRTTFRYHGAEHKAVNCYEKEKELTVEKAKKYSTIHPRCGTSFILLVVVISIIAYVFIPLNMGLASKLGIRLLMLPLIAGISYEFLKLSAKYENCLILKAIVSPGMLMQKITTKEPNDKQLEVAIHALKKVI